MNSCGSAAGRGVYTATIQTPGGSFVDRGVTELAIQAFPSLQSLGEVFLSSLAAPLPVKPGEGRGDHNHVHERNDLCKK